MFSASPPEGDVLGSRSRAYDLLIATARAAPSEVCRAVYLRPRFTTCSDLVGVTHPMPACRTVAVTEPPVELLVSRQAAIAKIAKRAAA